MRLTGYIMMVLALLFVCGVVLAAEAKPAEKPAPKPAAKPAEKAAAKPAAEKSETPAAKAADKKAETEPAKKDETKEDELTPLEKQLTTLQTALETASAENRNRIPGNAQALYPYLKNKEKDFINPETQQNILANTEMFGKYESRITKPEEFVTFYADAPTADKGRAAMFADGTIKYLTEEQFKKAMEASKIKKMTPDELQNAREERSLDRER